MEYVEGTDLTRLVRERGPLPVPLACDYIRQAALGLQHAHERRLVHRDVKPSNLLVTPRGQVKVLDLGLALLKRDAGSGKSHRMTQDGYILGTPDFLAPEQAQNPLGVDVRADIYALGATLFYLLAGRVPYDGATPAEKLVQHVTAPPPSLLQYRPDAPPQLDAIIQWMMAKRPEDRPQTAAQAAAALVPFCDPAIGTAPQPIYAAPPVAMPVAETLAFDAPMQTPREPRAAYRRSTSSGAGLKLAIFALIGLCGLLAAGGVGYVLWNNFGSEAPLPAEFTNVAGMKMIQLPGGSFVMGSPEGEPSRDLNEGPAGEVTLTGPFYMSATEVSEGQYSQIMGKSPAKWPRKMRKPSAVPVDSITWDEATEFCRKLTQRDGHRRAGWAYRLPTEAEWEYACRAGTTTPFWSGDKLTDGKQAIFNLDESGDLGEPDLSKPPIEKNLPYPVGSTEANPFGLFDMSGNVWEWCADYYVPDYANRAAENPKGPDTGDWRVLRGGSWREKAGRARSAARRGMSPTHHAEDVGFRVVFAPTK
jgi:formylglycine-generating enzyme required for sulfatase activity